MLTLAEQIKQRVAQLAASEPREALRHHVALGRLLLRAGDLEAALRYLHLALASPLRSSAPRLFARLLDTIAECTLQKGESQLAIAYREHILELNQSKIGSELLAAHVGIGRVHLFNDDLPRARAALATAQEWLQSHGATSSSSVGNRVEAELFAAQMSLVDRQPDTAAATLENALGLCRERRRPFLEGRVLRHLAAARRQLGRFSEADAELSEAATIFEIHGAKRELAQTYLDHGVFLLETGYRLQDVDPLGYIAKAQTIFGGAGNWKEAQRLRAVFRRFGRRTDDRLRDGVLNLQLDLVQEARRQCMDRLKREETALASLSRPVVEGGGVLDAEGVAQLVGASTRIVGATQQFLEVFSEAEAEVVSAINAIVADRDNVRRLLDVASRLTGVDTLDDLLAALPSLTCHLVRGDSSFVVTIDDEGRRHVAAARDMLVDELESVRELLDAVLLTGESVLSTRRGAAQAGRAPLSELGDVIGVPLCGRQTTLGGLFVFLSQPGRDFQESERDLLATFALYAGSALANARATADLAIASAHQAATIASITDGVVAFDLEGRVTLANPRAVRVLGRALDELRGLTFAELFGGTPLAQSFAAMQNIEREVLQLDDLELLADGLAVRGDNGRVSGYVVTLNEAKRVRDVAHHLVGSRARFTFEQIITADPEMERVIEIARIAARSDSTVLITGESGTGKEVIAQSIHTASNRAGGPFVAVNCAAIPRELLESELFGYESGAFTGARRQGQPGKFELADRGTILLDEIGDMPLEMQVKLLRVLQERSVMRVGGRREIPVSLRIIATTNRNLAQVVSAGTFREDLYYRLRVVSIAVPPLRERPGDIPVLVHASLKRLARALEKDVLDVSPEVMDAFVGHGWPGNVRELENVIEGALNLTPRGKRTIDVVPLPLRGEPERVRHAPDAGTPEAEEAPQSFAEIERQVIVRALTRAGGNIQAAADALKLSRGTIYNKIRRYNIAVGRAVSVADETRRDLSKKLNSFSLNLAHMFKK